MTKELIDALEKDIDSMDFDFFLKSKTEKGIYLLYDDSRCDEDKLYSIYKKHKNFSYNELSGFLPFEKLKEKYGLEIDQISENDKESMEKFGKELICFELKDSQSQ